nr:FBD-associated F-box protein At5g22730-like [Quercus suber]
MVPALDFEDTHKPNPRYRRNNNRMTFIHFVCGVLAVRKPVPLKKFRLQLISLNHSIHFHVRAWIYYAIGHGVEELDLKFFLCRPFELPLSVFSCKSIKILTLYGTILLNCRSESVYLPKIKHLRLLKVKYANEDSFHSLLTGSPHLQKLSVWSVQQDNTMTLNICHPTVEWLSTINEAKDHRFKLEINVPNLKFLSLVDSLYQFDLRSNVVKVTFNLFEHEQQANDLENYSHLFRPLTDAQTLILQYVESPCFDFSLPMLNNLRSLQLQVRCCQWHLLPNLLESAPNLVNLIINKEDTEGPHELSWTEPLHVPNCLELRIRRISLLQFRSLEHEVELIKYILKNAKVLERMYIFTGLSDLEESHQIFKIISELPRGSSACKPFLLNN